ncbi:MAG: GlmU family protein [Vicingaceae bacterium]|nr:GlmU family protein [Vicingaceae bacterium]
MNVIFFDDNKRVDFLPLVYTKPLAKIRIGILTIEEKWQHYFSQLDQSISVSYITEEYLRSKYPLKNEKENVFINTRFLPNKRLVDFIVNRLISDEAFFYKNRLIAAKCTIEQFQKSSYYIKDTNESLVGIELESITDIFSKNKEALIDDFELVTFGKQSQKISSTNTIFGDHIFIEEGAKVEAAILNSTDGPIYIGENAEVMEGSIVRGGLALCEGGVLKLGTKIYGATTIGKYSKVGGEVNNSVIQDYSNKGHDGFLGNSVIGEWCNLGADTNTSNLKNNYAEVKLWSYQKEKFEKTGLQFCGLLMGDHSKCGINTMFNTGTVVGVSANIFGSGFPRNFIPSYSWGGSAGVSTYKLDKVFEVAEIVMKRRGVKLSEADKEILAAIFEQSAKYRK